ncbi:MAG TPA: hypothetical protein VKY32_05940 [Flavobacterium sp.]|nr:hypothetical protein [Flavobacterium sp.]
MKEIMLCCAALVLLGCNEDELDDKIEFYKQQNKSEEIKGFWILKGTYGTGFLDTDVEIGDGYFVRIEAGEIMFLDDTYLRFLNKSDNGFSMSGKNRFYWFNDDHFIKSVHKLDFGENIFEFQLPYRFGQTKDTLIVFSQEKRVYLIKTEPVEYTEYVFE